MTTINNVPSNAKESSGGLGMVMGLIIFIVVAYLFVMFGLPALRQVQWGTPQINVPSKIDVNVTQQD